LTVLAAMAAIVSQVGHFSLEAVAVEAVGGALFGLGWWKSPPRPLVTPDQEILLRADQSAAVLWQLMRTRRLKGSLHPGVASVLNDCAGFWRRIVAASQLRIWGQPEIARHWNASRQDWTRAADLAMAEVLILAEGSLTLRSPRSKTEEFLEDVIDTFGIAKPRGDSQPLPVQFREIRDLAGKLQILSLEVESICRTIEAEPMQEPRPTASRRLDEVLGQMRALREAEAELHQTT
jgi:hypothetical protein